MSSKTMADAFQVLTALASKFTRGQDGMVVIWVAVLLPVLLGFAALAVDAAYLYAYKSRAQAAADAAALAAVYQIEGGNDTATQNAGESAALANIPATTGVRINSTTISLGEWNCSGVTYPSSCFTANSERSAAQAAVALGEGGGSGITLFLAKAIGFDTQGVGATAVANVFGGGVPDACIVSLEQDNKKAFVTNGNVVMNLTNCGVQVNSTGLVGPGGGATEIGADLGNADINTYNIDCLPTSSPPCDPAIFAGDADFNSVGAVDQGPQGELNDCDDSDPTVCVSDIPNESVDTVDDPFADFYPLAGAGGGGPGAGAELPCDFTNFVWDGTSDILPGVYCGGLSLSGGGTANFAPGVFVMQNGDFTVTGGLNLSGTGVAFALHNPSCTDKNPSCPGSAPNDDYAFKLTGTGSYTLSAPTTGDFTGLLFWDEPDRTACDDRSEFEASAGSSCDSEALHQFAGDGGMNFTGAIYAPFAETVISGNMNNGTSGSPGSQCALVVSNTFTYNGGGGQELSLGSSGCANLFPGAPFITDDVYALVE